MRQAPIIKDLPLTERPQQRLQDVGPTALSTRELLACLLQTPNALSQAQELTWRFGFPQGLLKASILELCQVPGIGPAKAVQLKAAFELGRRSLLDQQEDRLVVLSLDTKNRVLSQETLYIGNVNTSIIRIAEIFRLAIRQNAPAIIISHNHPSGDPDPSPEDVRVTRQIVEAGKMLDIDVLDHLVIGHQRYVSLKERGLGFG
jgi:DNA repair protein RadC